MSDIREHIVLDEYRFEYLVEKWFLWICITNFHIRSLYGFVIL